MKYLNIREKQTEISLMFSSSIDIKSLNSDGFIKKVKEEVEEILINIIVKKTRLETTIEQDLEEIIREFEIEINKLLSPEGISDLNQKEIKNILQGAFENNILNKKPGGYNTLYLKILIQLLEEINSLSNIYLGDNKGNEKNIIIKDRILQKIGDLRNLNFLDYIIEGYISKFEEILKSKQETSKIINKLI